jgi:DNA end-binding protein Ku
VARAMWKGAIQFGLVTIPVKLYLATESKYGVSFNMLHEKDLSRIQMKIWCPVDDKVIPRTETVKGYEWAPDQYVVITDEDLEKVPLKTMRSIEIEQFTKPDQEDGNVRFVKQAYYVEPDKIGRKAFYLLKQVLQDEELTAICKVVIKDREALAALDPFDKTMLLTTLHWPDEIRSIKELELPDEDFSYKPAELQMAKQLVAAMTGEFEPEKYKDEYREALMKVIEAKVEGKQVVEPAPVEESGNLIDLMAALEASVNAAKQARGGTTPVSVKDAKKARAGRTALSAPADKAKADKKPARAARSGRGKDADEEARPARRRKSA